MSWRGKSIFLLFVTATLPSTFLMRPVSHSSSTSEFPFLFLGFQHDEKLLESSIEFSFEKHRMELSKLMQTLSTPLSKTALSSKYAHLLQGVVDNFHGEISSIPALWEENEVFLRRLLNEKVPFIYCISNSVDEFSYDNRRISSYDSFHQLLVHIERDWGEGGRAVRQKSYTEGILPLIQKYLSITPDTKVLVPGAGLGRLAVELMVAGYRVEANECSGVMIRVIHSLLTDIIPSRENSVFYPYLHFNPTDEWDHNFRLRHSLFPSSDTFHISKWLNHFINSARNCSNLCTSRLTIQSGDFLSVYSPQSSISTPRGYTENSFDGIVTSFFLDTGTDLIDYLLTLHHLLRPGGIWVNSGPLHYHSVTNTPYSYTVVQKVIQSLGFISLESSTIESTYCGEEEYLMKPEYYRYPLEVWKLDKSESTQKMSTMPHTLAPEEQSKRFILNNFGPL